MLSFKRRRILREREEAAPERLAALIAQSRKDLAMDDLRWFVSQQPPTADERVNSIDVTSALEQVADADDDLIHTKAFELPKQEKKIVITTSGIVALGEVIAESYLKHR